MRARAVRHVKSAEIQIRRLPVLDYDKRLIRIVSIARPSSRHSQMA
jgi:CBS domain-containing protein